MREIRTDSSLGQIIKKTVQQATGPRLGVESAKYISRGSEYSIKEHERPTDSATKVQFTYREMSVDLGAYIEPTADLFESTAVASGITPDSDIYVSENGNISRHIDPVGSYFGLYSANLYIPDPSGVDVDITINTAHSLWIGVDDETKVSTGTLTDNQNAHTSCTLPLASGWNELEIGIYSQSGPVDYRFGGDLALQVARIDAPDKTAPDTPNTPTVTAQLMDPITNRVEMLVEWTNQTGRNNWDLLSYNIYRYETTDGDFSGLTDNDYELVSSQNRTIAGITNKFRDTNIKYGNYYQYKIQGVDWRLNKSALSTGASDQAVDTTGPSTVSSLTVAAQYRTGIGLTWTWPSDADLAGAIVYLDGTTDSDKVKLIPYDGNSSFSGIIGGLPSGSNLTLYVRTFDKAGNQGSSTVSVATNTTGFDELDTTPPGGVTDIYIDDTNSVAAGATHTLNDNQFSFLLYFIMPSDSDVAGVEIRIGDNGPALGRFNASFKLADLAAGPSEEVEFIVNFQEASQTQYLFFDTYDKSGNYLSSTTAPPTWIKVTSTLVPGGGIKDVILLNPSVSPNELGWWNTTNITFTPTVEGAGVYSYGNFQYLAEGQNWGDVYGASVNWTTNFAKGETDADGETLGIKIVNDDDGEATGPFLFTIKVDTSAPTVGSVSASTSIGGVTLNITNGSDSISGLWKTEIWRSTTSSSGDASRIATILTDETEYVDKTASAGEKYWYWIKQIDKAGNTSGFSSSTSVKVVPKQFYGALNILRNSSFEELTARNAEFVGWDRGDQAVDPTGWLSGNVYHGENAVIVGTGNAWLEQTGINIFPDANYCLSFYAMSGASAAAKVDFTFKDAAGETLQTDTVTTAALTGSFARVYQNSGGNTISIGPSGDTASIIDYPADTATMDIKLYGTGDLEIDAVMLEETYYGGAGVGWKNIYTDSLFPNDYVESASLNLDYISAWIGRFGTFFAEEGRVRGKISSVSGDTYLDLENDELRLTHESGQTWTELSPSGLTKTLDGGATEYNYIAVKRFTYDFGSSTSGSHTWVVATGVTEEVHLEDYDVIAATCIGTITAANSKTKVPLGMNGRSGGLALIEGGVQLTISTTSEFIACTADFNDPGTVYDNYELEVLIGHSAFVSYETAL